MNDRDFRRHARHLLFAWMALLVLMLSSLASAYLPLGIGNAVAGVAIAIVKTAIVAALFMGLARSGALLRIVAAVALATWCILLVLGGLEQATRPEQAAIYQQPQQLERQP